jgi:outer membrane lipoprotein-sorting protein
VIDRSSRRPRGAERSQTAAIGRWTRLAILASAGCVAACAARAPMRPAGTSTPDPTAVDAFTQATKSCAGLKTMTGALRLSGRAGSEKIRGTLHTGLEAPASIRFEAVAPFGQPFFILAGRDNRASLLLPRDNRLLPDASVPELLERLTGLALGASDMRLILSGCLSERPQPTDGRTWSGGWRAVTLGDGVTAYLKAINGASTLVAADRGAWRIDYADHQNGWPRTVRIRSAEGQTTIDITAAIEDLEVNTPIDAKAFAIEAPAGAARMTIDDLRSVTPLRGTD